jgi:hypothetical protein
MFIYSKRICFLRFAKWIFRYSARCAGGITQALFSFSIIFNQEHSGGRAHRPAASNMMILFRFGTFFRVSAHRPLRARL